MGKWKMITILSAGKCGYNLISVIIKSELEINLKAKIDIIKEYLTTIFKNSLKCFKFFK